MGGRHEVAAILMIGEPEDELAKVVCVCGWESARVWSSELDGVSEAFREHLRASAALS